MRGYIFISVIFFLLLFQAFNAPEKKPPAVPGDPRRIISLAPAITETLFMLGMGDRVAGVTQFCDYPPQAAARPKISGFQEVNLEAILRQKPDLVMLPKDMEHARPDLERLGLPVFIFDYQSLPAFLESTLKTAKLANREREATAFMEKFQFFSGTQMERPKILFIILNPEDGAELPADMTIIGSTGFYNDLIGAAGGCNAYKGPLAYPRISLEASIAMQPDIIVISAPFPQLPGKGPSESLLLGDGKKSVVWFDDPGDTIPGPRSLQTFQKLRNAINDWRLGK